MGTPVYDWIAIMRTMRRTPRRWWTFTSGRRFTYSECNCPGGAACRIPARWAGVSRGDRVAVLSASSSDVFEIQFACFRIGAVFVPLNWRLAAPELAYIVADATPRC